jgi:hypothetical protein
MADRMAGMMVQKRRKSRSSNDVMIGKQEGVEDALVE